MNTLAQMRSYSTHLDREVRKAATSAVAGWYMQNAGKLDEIYDKLVKVRDGIAKKLGFKNFVEVGYCRMRRNCYDAAMVKKFRDGVVEHIVPVVTRLKAEQAKRIGAETIKVYDNTFEYPDGNARPQGTPDDIFAHGKKMYHELSPETAEFIDFMMENELFDVLSKPGKAVGGYCATIDDHKSPFIFANFNGTSGDIDVLTHEAGHALASFQSRDMEPAALKRYTSETAEVHSMSMEFFTWPWMEGFFGPQTEKYYLSHLTDGLTFLPYGSMVDEFQHHVYERPEMSPKERNEVWLSLERKYRPWYDIAGSPFVGDGRIWQGQMHIYRIPFYYIDYCLARTISLCFWALSQKDKKQSWDKYMRLIGFAGTKTFLDLVTDAGMPTPFEGDTLKQLADSVVEWLDGRK
jgi:M3 family oligoendopeptidase